MSDELTALADKIEARLAEAAKKHGFVRAAVHYDEAPTVVTALRSYAAAQGREPVAWRIRVADGSYCKVIPEGELEIWKQNWSRHLESGYALLEPLCVGTAPPIPPPAAGWDEAIEAAKLVVERWSLPTVQTPSMWLVDKAGIVAEIEALRANAPSGATKSAPPGRSSLPPNQGESEHAVTCASGGADAVVKAQIATLAQRFWTIHPRELQDKGMTREEFYIREMTALVASLSAHSPASAEARLRGALTGIQRQSNAAYCRYIDQMSKPECLGFEAKLLSGKFSKIELDAHARAGEMIGAHRALSDAVKQINEALSQHPHASNCARNDWEGEGLDCGCGGGWKVGHRAGCSEAGNETTKSEGVQGKSQPASGAAAAPIETGDAGVAPGPSEPRGCPTPGACSCAGAKDWMRQIINAGGSESVAQQAVALAALNGLFNRPEDRVGDVTHVALADFIFGIKIFDSHVSFSQSNAITRAILDARTVRRR